jgi:predicted dehydrogenase
MNDKIKKTTRRNFLTQTGAAAAGLTLGVNSVSAKRYSRIMGSNEKIRTGFIGVGNQGSLLLNEFMEHDVCEVIALCDVYEPFLRRDRSSVDPRYLETRGGYIRKMGEKFANQPTTYSDYRKLLENKDLDAVVIATPDHWHALQCIDACDAGLHVYVEKPLSITIKEGRAMVNAQKRAGNVVQVGLNRRGSKVFQKLAREIPAGKIGKVAVGRSGRRSNMYPNGIGRLGPERPPKGFDWDMWLGPRAFRPYQYNICPYMFRWWDDYSSQMGNWGVHYMDVIRWMMGETAPVAITAHGGKYLIDHDATIPDTMEVIFEFASKKIITFSIYEATSANQFFPYGEVELQGTKGNLFASSTGYRVFPGRAGQFQTWEPEIEVEEYNIEGGVGREHMIPNFLACIKDKYLPLLCPLEEGHRSTTFAHLANIALKVGKRLQWDPVLEVFTNSNEANEMLHYEYRKPWKIQGL